jgi:hypothetical protein
MQRGVAAGTIDAFGVVVECAGGIDEDKYRCVASVYRRELVDGLHRPAGAQPVGGAVQLGTDHHHCRYARRWVGGEPCGHAWSVLKPVPEDTLGQPIGDDGAGLPLVELQLHRSA